jgi:hypothetical protein
MPFIRKDYREALRLARPDAFRSGDALLPSLIMCHTFNGVRSGIIDPMSLADGPWLAGGAIRRDLFNKSMADFDFFFKSRNSWENTRICFDAHHAWDEIEYSSSAAPGEGQEPSPDVKTYRCNDWKVQLVGILFMPHITALLERFPFTVQQFGTDGETLYYGDRTLQDCAMKQLVHPDTFSGEFARGMLRRYERQGFNYNPPSTSDRHSYEAGFSNAPTIIVEQDEY